LLGTVGKIGGGIAGALLPFKNGGRIPGPKGKAKLIIAHGGEFVLPNGVAPTMKQKKAVARRHKK
jgi:hypothetical protein